MKVSGGKIVAAWSCWDAASFLTQIDALPGAPDAPRLGEVDLEAWRSDGRTSRVDPDLARAVVRRVYRELWSDGTLVVADELIAPQFVGHTPGNHATSGPGGMKRLVRWWRSVLSGLEFQVDAQHAEGGAVATRFTASGKHAAAFAGRAPTGAQVTMTGIALAHVTDGQLVSDWGEFDLAGVLRVIDRAARATTDAR
jgi:predicted ester cyclase